MRLNPERSGKRLDGRQRDVSLTTFYAADVGSMKAAPIGEFLLGEAQLLAQATNVCGQHTAKRCVGPVAPVTGHFAHIIARSAKAGLQPRSSSPRRRRSTLGVRASVIAARAEPDIAEPPENRGTALDSTGARPWGGAPAAMKFLIDTNILISLEPTSSAAIEPGAREAAEVARMIQQSGNTIVVHPHVLADIARDHDLQRRAHREYVLGKYPTLDGAPPITAADEAVLGVAAAASNDWVDNHLLVAVARDAVDYVITQDNAIHARAGRLGIADRVLTTADALMMLRALFPTTPTPPPAVRSVRAHTLIQSDPIFDSFRDDYADFDSWLRRCKLQDRPTWVIDGDRGLAAVCIAKSERDAGHGMAGNILKVCSFKVSESRVGARFGELMLKTIFVYAHENAFEWIYVTVFEKHEWLIALLKQFGFDQSAERTKLGELVMTKPTRPTADPAAAAPLDYAIRFGPCRWSWDCANVWIVPIQPRFEQVLFPERQEQAALFSGMQPSGNAIRKAYLCRAPLRVIEPGDVLAFYRSTDSQGIRTLGVVENWIASTDPERILQFVSRRTVYSMADIKAMASGEREVLAIRFRQVLHEFHEIPYTDLRAANVVAGPPQTIVRARPEGLPWLIARLPPSR